MTFSWDFVVESSCVNGIKACLICSGFKPMHWFGLNELFRFENQERLAGAIRPNWVGLSSYGYLPANTAAIMQRLSVTQIFGG